MSWQEELRRLDVERAEGRITHERHRKLADEILAGASGGAAPSPRPSPLRHPDGRRNAEPTVPPPPPKPAPQFATDRSTSAPSPADLRTTDSISFPPAAKPRLDSPTVVRPTVLPPPPPPVPVVNTQPGSARPMDDPFPSLKVKTNHVKPIWLFVAVGVLLVLGVVLTAMWQLSSSPPGGNAGPVPPTPSTTRSAAPAPTPALASQLPALPGMPDKNNSTVSIAKGVELGLYPTQAADAFTRNGATEVIYRGSTEGSYAYFVLVVATKAPENARALVDFLGETALSSGYSKGQGGPAAVTGLNGDRRMNGTWYASGSTMVNLWVSQPSKADKKPLTERFDQTLASLQKVLPET